jgi:hypothetical protein
MPFTLAHPAAAMPLARPLGRFGVLPALIIGAMIPDFAYFRPFLDVGRRSHTVAGLFLFCLPVGGIVYVLFRVVLARPMLALLPDAVRSRVRLRRDFPPLAIVVSVLAGAATHLVWDSFTHDGTPMVEAIPILRRELVTVGGYPLRVHRLLQHVSTVIGVSLILAWLVRWYRCTPSRAQSPPMASGLRVLAAGVILAGAAISGMRGGLGVPHGPSTVSVLLAFAGGAVIAGFSTFAVLLASYAVAWHLGPPRLTGRR